MGSARACQEDLFSGSQQRIGADQVGLDKCIGTCNRSIHVTFRSEVHQRIDFVVSQGFAHSLTITNIPLDENNLTRVLQRRKAGSISCIGQGVIDNHPVLGVTLTPVIHKVGANEAGPSSDK